MEEFFRAGGRMRATTAAGFMNPPPPPSSAAASTSTAATTTARPAVVALSPSADSDFVREYCTPNLHPLTKRRPFHLDVTSQSSSCSSSNDHTAAMKAKIVAHPQYSSLVASYIECQKVGAPPDVASRLSAAAREVDARQRAELVCHDASSDPELDQFMEAYQQMLDKYRGELMKPLQESMEFIHSVESQLNSITNASFRVLSADGNYDTCSSEEDRSDKVGETDQVIELDPHAEDRELKNHLLKKYRGYLSSLRKELCKKKKKGKLPKDARQKLLNWWEIHYKWPYPSETEKIALAESTGLDQKQINNWFINQRKRHWKPSEDMQFMSTDGYPYHPPPANVVYLDGYSAGNVLHHVTP